MRQISEQIVPKRGDGCDLSGNSTDSHNVVKEAMLASEQKKALLPVYLESAEIPARLQYQLAGIQHLELYSRGRAGSGFGDGSEEAGCFGWRR